MRIIYSLKINTKSRLIYNDKFQFIKHYNNPRQTIKNLSGIIICLLQSSFLSVGAFCERPRANRRACSDVRPYRVSGDFSAKNISLSVGAVFCRSVSFWACRTFPSEIPSALCLTLLCSSTSLRSAQDDTTEKHEAKPSGISERLRRAVQFVKMSRPIYFSPFLWYNTTNRSTWIWWTEVLQWKK